MSVKKPTHLRRKLLLLLLSVLFALALGELVVRRKARAWPFATALAVPPHLSPQDEALRWRYTPENGRNSLGLRSREIEPKAPGTSRILFLGDSLVYSGETTSEALYTELVEQRLNKRLASRDGVFEVINAGVPGYTTYQELEFLRLYGLDMAPDLVVLGFVFNDVYDKYLHKPTEAKMLDHEPRARLNRLDPDSLFGRLLANSHLAHELTRRAGNAFRRVRGEPHFSFRDRADFYLAWETHGWTASQGRLAEMKSLLDRHDILLALIVFPVSEQVDDKVRELDEAYVLYPQSQITKICALLDIPCLDLTDRIHENGGPALYRDYLHLNGRGNEVIVEPIEDFLVERIAR